MTEQTEQQDIDPRVAVFSEAWEKANAEGRVGERVAAGLAALDDMEGSFLWRVTSALDAEELAAFRAGEAARVPGPKIEMEVGRQMREALRLPEGVEADGMIINTVGRAMINLGTQFVGARLDGDDEG